jgi:hypothetical protein
LRAEAGAGRRKYPSLAAGIHPKLLNMRDFPTFEGFPPPPKTRYNSFLANRRRASACLFPPAWLFMPNRAIG